MRVLPIDDIPLGAPLGQALFNDRGDVLAQIGVRLDNTLVNSIKARRYNQVVVDDPVPQGTTVAHPLSPPTDGKTGTPTPADVEQVKRHTQLGYDFLGHVPGFEPLANQIAFQHHEWFNGGGYPRGLVGTSWGAKVDGSKNIMLIAQITSVA